MKKEKFIQLYSVDDELEGSVDDAIEKLEKLKVQYGQDYLRLELISGYDRWCPDAGTSLFLMGVRLENDNEEAEREERENKEMQQNLGRERQKFEELKKKFEGEQK